MSVFWSKDNKYKWAIQMQRGVGESIILFMFYSFFRVGKSYSLSASRFYQCQWTRSIAYTHFQTAISIGISVLTHWQLSPALTKSEFSGLQVKKMDAPSQKHSICGPSGKCILLAIYSDQLCLLLWDCAADQVLVSASFHLAAEPYQGSAAPSHHFGLSAVQHTAPLLTCLLPEKDCNNSTCSQPLCLPGRQGARCTSFFCQPQPTPTTHSPRKL